MWSFIVCIVVMLILRDGAWSQVPDYETTPLPLPPTSFSCQGRPPGYYADLETGCRTYHVCDGNSHFTYVCPARTLFQQRSRICDHAYLVRCEDASTFFEDDIYPSDEDEILRHLADSEDQAHTERVDVDTQTEEFVTTEQTEISTATTKKPTTVATEIFRKGNATSADYSSESGKILKFVVKDIRSLFYIPEVDNNSITIQVEKEVMLPVDRKNLLRFRNGKKVRHTFSACPSYCDPKFFLPGTCHPCIMIK